jgi:hypothetical protein
MQAASHAANQAPGSDLPRDSPVAKEPQQNLGLARPIISGEGVQAIEQGATIRHAKRQFAKESCCPLAGNRRIGGRLDVEELQA